MIDNFEYIIDLLNKGKIILYPTDTIWGLGCDALNNDAIDKIYSLKNREKDKPFILLVSGIDMLKEYVKSIHPRIETLLLYHKRPLTIIYPKGEKLSNVFTKNKKIAIRIVQEPVIAAIIKEFGHPIISTSANIAGTKTPRIFSEIDDEIIKSVDYVFKYRQNDITPLEPSVIATFNKNGKLKFLR